MKKTKMDNNHVQTSRVVKNQPRQTPTQETMEDNQRLTNAESTMILAAHAKTINEAHQICEAADKEAKRQGQEAITAGIKAGQYLIQVKEMVGHGNWLPWLDKNCPKLSEKMAQRYMKLAKNDIPVSDLNQCKSLRQAFIAVGALSPQRYDKAPEVVASETAKIVDVNSPEIILNQIRNGLEAISRQYDSLTKLDPKLNSFLLGKGYSNDFPLLWQQWPSSLSDIYAYFKLPPVAPDVCVCCGHVREWNELFVPISAYYPFQHLQSFNEWCQQCDADYDYDFEKKTFTRKHIFEDLPEAIKQLTDNLNELKGFEVGVYTLYQKHSQLQNLTIATPKEITAAENNVWMPTDLNDEALTLGEIQRMSPKIVICRDKASQKLWEIYKHCTASSDYNRPPTRNIFFLVVDDSLPNKPVLGIGCASGDMLAVRERDDFIGWTKEQRQGVKDADGKVIKPAMTRHTANGTTIIPTQPFGYNFVGGKLIAALITSQVIRDEWKSNYGDVLTGLTTTSLFGREDGTMYDAVKQWKGLGKTTGRVPITPRHDIWERWKSFVAETRTHELNKVIARGDDDKSPVTNEKTKVLTLIFKAAGLRLGDYQHGHKRGLYFSEVYVNTKDFLCGRIGENELTLKPLFKETVEEITDRWKKQAVKRYLKLKADGKLNPAKVSYSQLGQMDFDTARKTFLPEEGQ